MKQFPFPLTDPLYVLISFCVLISLCIVIYLSVKEFIKRDSAREFFVYSAESIEHMLTKGNRGNRYEAINISEEIRELEILATQKWQKRKVEELKQFWRAMYAHLFKEGQEKFNVSFN